MNSATAAHFAQISAPLNKFTRKDAITSPAVLVLPDPSQPYIIRRDAARVGIGAVVLQKQPSENNDKSTTSIYKPVAFAS
ncbi:unnamed protein product [Rotaria sp. Silwood1]|nr:unnamed protein product [Rotaria sp. Silwood1]CAF3942611.1 unnamed protein product [Rotaria sp. Silwood1]CAF4919167.1 unnamed protein product [Rotaria sp. Silwood1]CAF4980884.1 unnamed protein product [Rotaria sp. Silwood1]CAF5006711.1 unnamed protein product [Rotaria sp. Silwood1]